jgi:hypothetical protein
MDYNRSGVNTSIIVHAYTTDIRELSYRELDCGNWIGGMREEELDRGNWRGVNNLVMDYN